MVVYTTDARVAAGGQAAIETLIDLAVSDANAAFGNSAIDTSLNLVHTEEVSYVETGLNGIDAPRLIDPDDGFLDGVHPLRDQYGADCVSLWVNTLDTGGVGFYPDPSFQGVGASGFSMLRLDQAAILTFAHEIGHNLYCAHDRPSHIDLPPFAEYSYGYREPGDAWRTIMAVAGGDVIPYFANPNVNWPGPAPPNPGPTGVPVGQPDPSDVALTINQMRHVVANFRPTAVAGLGPIMHVAADASPAGDGQSWGTAFDDLNDALCTAAGGNGAVDEIWVKNGVYTPDRGSGDRSASFRLRDGMAIYGGFAGNESLRSVRGVEPTVSILSGDIGTIGVTDDNSYHVVDASGADATAILDGFIITAGNADGTHPHDGGGGVLVRGGGSAHFIDCVITANQASRLGGGMCNTNGSNPTVEDCSFSNNTVTDPNWPAGGGGMFNHSDSSPTLIGCSFSGNSARLGSGMANFFGSSPTISGCTFDSNIGPTGAEGSAIYGYSNCAPVVTDTVFVGNSAAFGGAIYYIFAGDPTFDRCLFVGNSAVSDGGGLYCHSGTDVRMTNCVLTGNTASFGGAMSNLFDSDAHIVNCTIAGNTGTSFVGGIYNYQCDPVLANSLLWQNDSGGFIDESAQIAVFDGAATIGYSTIQGWTGGLGGSNNNGVDPLLVDLDGSDNTIGTTDDNPRLLFTSSAIDGGSNGLVPMGVTLDYDGHDRLYGAAVDRGAFERVPGDADNDGDIDLTDHTQLADCLNGPGTAPSPTFPVTGQDCLDWFDADGDSDVDLSDAGVFADLFDVSP